MTQVKVEFTYTPDDPDENDPSGMSSEEYDQLMDSLMPLGAEDIRVEKV